MLVKNLELLPGRQIKPDDPRRWLLVRREMPVPDPNTTGNRWSVDLFVVDQEGTPTFVECKRFRDSRSRREVIGQMFDYAANGNYYWDKEIVRSMLEQEASLKSVPLDEYVFSIAPTTGDSVEDFLEAIEANLREGQVRLVFFMEEAPLELKSIVDFLNRQMERTEVLIIEAKQYDKDGIRFVLPTLFGYTEEARRVKRSVVVQSGNRRQWNESQFFEEITKNLVTKDVEVIKRIFKSSKDEGYLIKWGTGKQRGSFSVVAPSFSGRSVFSIFTDGQLWLSFKWLNESDEIIKHRDALAEKYKNLLGSVLPEDANERFVNLKKDKWIDKGDRIVAVIGEVLAYKDSN